GIIGLGSIYCNLVIAGIDLHQWRPRIHILVVINKQLLHVPRNSRADCVQLAIDLRVTSRCVTGKVAPQDEANHEQRDQDENEQSAKARTPRSSPPAKVPLR